jgi:hypothetical protein
MSSSTDVPADEAWLSTNLPTAAKRHAGKIAAKLQTKDGFADTTEDLKTFTSLQVLSLLIIFCKFECMIHPGLLQDWVGPEQEGGFGFPRPIGVIVLELVSSLHKRQRTGTSHHSHSALHALCAQC